MSLCGCSSPSFCVRPRTLDNHLPDEPHDRDRAPRRTPSILLLNLVAPRCLLWNQRLNNISSTDWNEIVHHHRRCVNDGMAMCSWELALVVEHFGQGICFGLGSLTHSFSNFNGGMVAFGLVVFMSSLSFATTVYCLGSFANLFFKRTV